MEDGKHKMKGFMIIDDGTMPISKEGSGFIGWMEMRLAECLAVEDYEEAANLKRDIESARAAIIKTTKYGTCNEISTEE